MKLPPDLDSIPHRKSAKGLIFNVRVEPRSSKSTVVGVVGEALKVKLTAPPVEGAANKQLVVLLADYFGVRKSDVHILRGRAGKNKVVEIRDLPGSP